MFLIKKGCINVQSTYVIYGFNEIVVKENVSKQKLLKVLNTKPKIKIALMLKQRDFSFNY